MVAYLGSGLAVSTADLAASELFAGLDHSVLQRCADRADLVTFPRGSLLAREGEFADALFVLVSGSVEVVLEQPGRPRRFVDVLERGDCVGEMALLLNQPRTATVRALRDCHAARISEADFAFLLQRSPEFSVRLARMLGTRLQRSTARIRVHRKVEAMVVIASSPDIALDRLRDELRWAVENLEKAQRSGRRCTLVKMPYGARLEKDDLAALRDADAIVIAGDASKPPDTAWIERLALAISEFRPKPHLALALLHDAGAPSLGTLPWLRAGAIQSWHHIHPGRRDDFLRAARRLTGRATSLVLSGGGARGFAHVGILRALEDARIPIDFIAGTSMGAIVAAQFASGRTPDQVLAALRDIYVERRGRQDFAVPFVAIRSGEQAERQLREMFGEARIENLAVPYFCVSSNLSTAETVVHDRGRLWHAIRCSLSVPGLMPPIRTPQGLLVDGGLLDNLPVGAMQQRCPGQVIAADVSVAVEFRNQPAPEQRPPGLSRRFRRRGMPTIGQILNRTVQLASVRDSRTAGTPADLYLSPPVEDVGMSDFSRLNEIVERGFSYARGQLENWVRHE